MNARIVVLAFLIWLTMFPMIAMYFGERKVRPAQNAGRMHEAWLWCGAGIGAVSLWSALCLLVAVLAGAEINGWFWWKF